MQRELRPYGLPKHRHLSEIEQEFSLAAGHPVMLQFTPHLIPVNRGILSTLYLTPKAPVQAASGVADFGKRWRRATKGPMATSRSSGCLEGKALPDTKNVVGTNVCELAWRLDARTGRLIVMSAEDNLLKGASGQAVQSLNIHCGWPRPAGLV